VYFVSETVQVELESDNPSDFCAIGGASRGCLKGVKQVSGVFKECLGCILCQKRFRLSWKVTTQAISVR